MHGDMHSGRMHAWRRWVRFNEILSLLWQLEPKSISIDRWRYALTDKLLAGAAAAAEERNISITLQNCKPCTTPSFHVARIYVYLHLNRR